MPVLPTARMEMLNLSAAMMPGSCGGFLLCNYIKTGFFYFVLVND